MGSFKKWFDSDEKFLNFFLSEIKDGFEGLRILLKSEIEDDKEIVIFFNNYLSYRVTDELAFQKNFENGDVFNFGITNESAYLDWFQANSLDIFKDYNLEHYFIYGSNKVVEIIAGASPSVELNPNVG